MKKLISISIVISLLLSCFPCCTPSAEDNLPSINISANVKKHDILHGSAGFLYGISNEGVPDINTLTPLKPKVLATKGALGTEHPYGDALDVADEFFESGGEQIQMYNSNYYGVFGVTANAYEYGKVLEDIIAPHVAQWKNTMRGKYPDIDSRMVYIPINEGTPVNGVTNFNEAWKIYYNAIKASDKNAVIAGPNDAVYRGHSSMYDFLEFCRDNSCLPDVISWHELQVGCLNTMDDHIADYKNIAKSLGIKEKQIVINEYADFSDCGVPGRLVNWIARLEDEKVYGCLPFWHQANNLNDLAANANDGNGAWWVYKWYGDMSGQVVSLKAENTSYDQFYGLSSIDETKQSLCAIVGGNDGDGIVNFNSLSDTAVFKNAENVRVKVEASYFTGYHGASGEPEVIMEGVLPVIDNSVSLRLSDMLFSTAYRITLTKTTDKPYMSKKGYRAYYEAEDAVHYGNLIFENESAPIEKPRYFCSGRVRMGGFDEADDGIEYKISVPHDGLYRLDFIYGNGVGSTRNNALTHAPLNITQKLYIDVEERILHLPNTLFYSMEGMVSEYANLTRGTHSVKIMSNGDEGAFHDVLYVSYAGSYDEPLPIFDYIYESESADFNPNSSAFVESSIPYFSQSGYVSALNEVPVDLMGGIRHVVRVSESGLYNIAFRYISPENGAIRLFVDNTNLTYSNYLTDVKITACNTWEIAHTTVFLRQGLNIIDYDMTCQGNIDYMRVIKSDDDQSSVYEAEDSSGSFDVLTNSHQVSYVAPVPGDENAHLTDGMYFDLNVNAPFEGLYKMQVFQSNNDLCGTHSYNIKIIDRYASFMVNSDFDNAVRYFFPNTFSDDTFAEKTIPLNLKKGENTIRIYNDNSWNVLWGGSTSTPGENKLANYTPNFDKFIITPAVTDSPLRDTGFKINVLSGANGYAYTDKNTAQNGDRINLYLIPEGRVTHLSLNGENILPTLQTDDGNIYHTSFIANGDMTISAFFSPYNKDEFENPEDNSTITINGKVHSIIGENLFTNPTFSDNSGNNLDMWFTGTNKSGHPDDFTYQVPKINPDGTYENLIPLASSGLLTTGVFEQDKADSFYFGRDASKTYLVEHMASNWQHCAWNGASSLLAFVPIKENTNYFFSFDAFTVSGKASVRFGAIDMNSGENFYVPSSYKTNESLNFTSSAFDCTNGDIQNVGGSWTTHSLAFSSGEGADYFLFNTYWLQMAEYLCMGNFKLYELSEAADCEITSLDLLPAKTVTVGNRLSLDEYIDATDETGNKITLSIKWLNADTIDNHTPGVYHITGEVTPPSGYYISDKYITQRVIVTRDYCRITSWSVKDDTASINISAFVSAPASLITASYENGVLQSVVSAPLNLEEGKTITKDIALSGGKAVVFIWNKSTLVPLADAKEIVE